jgi:hypothetical protein
MKYLCIMCSWVGEKSGDPWPCPKCGIGDEYAPLEEWKESLDKAVEDLKAKNKKKKKKGP